MRGDLYCLFGIMNKYTKNSKNRKFKRLTMTNPNWPLLLVNYEIAAPAIIKIINNTTQDMFRHL